MRIVGGELHGRTLKAPASQNIRPTSDRLRESLFNILVHGYGDPVTGAKVIDIFAGTGALGLEALSRGASFALFVDESAEARGLIRSNVEAFGLGGITRIFRRNAARLGAMPKQAPFTLAFLDPPYGKGLGEQALASLREGGWLAEDALVILEESASAAIDLPEGYAVLDRREYGDTQVLVMRHRG